MVKSICSVFLQNSPLYCKIIFDVFYQKITKILKLKDLCKGKTTPIHAVYLITKKKTHILQRPKILIKVFDFWWGVPVRFLLNAYRTTGY